MDLCPKPTRKMKKIEEFLRNGFSGKMGEKWKIGLLGGRAVGGYGGEWPEMFSRWWGRWWVWVVLDLGRRRTEEGLEGGCTAERGKWGKSDLKNCSCWPKTEYV
jgi:hypothetical protein